MSFTDEVLPGASSSPQPEARDPQATSSRFARAGMPPDLEDLATERGIVVFLRRT